MYANGRCIYTRGTLRRRGNLSIGSRAIETFPFIGASNSNVHSWFAFLSLDPAGLSWNFRFLEIICVPPSCRQAWYYYSYTYTPGDWYARASNKLFFKLKYIFKIELPRANTHNRAMKKKSSLQLNSSSIKVERVTYCSLSTTRSEHPRQYPHNAADQARRRPQKRSSREVDLSSLIHDEFQASTRRQLEHNGTFFALGGRINSRAVSAARHTDEETLYYTDLWLCSLCVCI